MADSALLPADMSLMAKSQHEVQKRCRRQQELRGEDAAEGSIERALTGLRVGSAVAARAISRMCADREMCAECYRQGALAVVVNVLAAGGDADVALPCCRALSRLCAGAAEAQTEAVITRGVLPPLLARLDGCVDDVMVTACCHALAHVATGVGAAQRRELATSAGALAVLVAQIQSWEEGGPTRAACCTALRSLTRDSVRLQDAARAAGAEAGWLL